MNKARILSLLRTVHGWLGIFIFPWVLIAGLSGFYLNHEKAVLNLIMPASFDESGFSEWPRVDRTREEAVAQAESLWPGETPKKVTFEPYHRRDSIIVQMPSGRLIVSRETGHYFIKQGVTRETYAPDGTLLNVKTYWGMVFKRLHTRGWLNNAPGTWIADITAFALVGFALSGIVLWWLPRARRFGRFFRKVFRRKATA